MSEKPNFVLVPDSEPEQQAAAVPAVPSATPGRWLRKLVDAATALLPLGAMRDQAHSASDYPPPAQSTGRPRLVFGFDATASREPAWATAKQVTDALFRALPGELDVALAVHGGSHLHTFTDFTTNANTLRDRAASIRCLAGHTQLLPILARSIRAPGVRVVTYIGDVFEESLMRGRRLADTMGQRGIRLIVLHDTADWNARRDGEIFLDLARRTGGCVLPFDASAPARLRELLAAVAVYAVGGTELLEQKRDELPAAVELLEHLSGRR